MQTVLQTNQHLQSQRRLSAVDSFRITERDLSILEFVLNMKFAAIEDIHEKLFRLTRRGEQSVSLRWARERVANLVRCQFLQANKTICHKTLYCTTMRGYLYLKNSILRQEIARPTGEIDSRIYLHDHQVTKIRLLLESQGQVTEWISERQLLEIEEYKDHFSSEFRPDGIYVTPDGSKVAFELEIARKSKERYQQKIKRYIDLLIHPKVNPPLFHRVHYVCEKPTVLKLVQSYTELFSHFFHFELTQSVQLQKKEQS